jgi:hypothetical protein
MKSGSESRQNTKMKGSNLRLYKNLLTFSHILSVQTESGWWNFRFWRQVFCEVKPCSPVDIFRRFTGAYWVISLMVEAASISKKSGNFYQATCFNVLEKSSSESGWLGDHPQVGERNAKMKMLSSEVLRRQTTEDQKSALALLWAPRGRPATYSEVKEDTKPVL